MIRFIFDNEKKMNKLEKKFKKKKLQKTEIYIIIVAMYVLTKVAIRHEMELSNLKKSIEEIKSKGA